MRELILIRYAQDVKGDKMCVHYWMLDSCDKGICKHCGEQRNFSPPTERLTRAERAETRIFFNHDYYWKGSICQSEFNAQLREVSL